MNEITASTLIPISAATSQSWETARIARPMRVLKISQSRTSIRASGRHDADDVDEVHLHAGERARGPCLR